MYKDNLKRVKNVKTQRLNGKQKIVLSVLIITALLWLTESVHGVHNSVVAMIPIFVFFGSGLLKKQDIKEINWPVLILVGGGLCLGYAMYTSGLAETMAKYLAGLLVNQPIPIVLLSLSLFSILLTAFAANTATAAMFVPVVIPLAEMLGIDTKVLAMLVGMAVSLDMIVPVGTPPNAIAYGTGLIKVKDMIKAGLFLSIFAAFWLSFLAMLW